MKICSDKSGNDKWLHFTAGLLICILVGVVVAHIFPHNPWLTVAISMGTVLLAAVAKELRDARVPGNHFCVWDLLFTLLGGASVAWLPWLAAFFIALE